MPERTTLAIEVSATELPQFRRLVHFAAQVIEHADEVEDCALSAMCDELFEDLLKERFK